MKYVCRVPRGGLNTTLVNEKCEPVKTAYARFAENPFQWLCKITILNMRKLVEWAEETEMIVLWTKMAIQSIPSLIKRAIEKSPRSTFSLAFRLVFLLSLICLVTSTKVSAQTGAPISGQALTPTGTPANHAQVTVCPYTSIGAPCFPQSSIYSDSGLTVPLTQPYSTDQYGNYSFWVANNATYLVQIKVSQTLVYSYYKTVGSGGGSSVTLQTNGIANTSQSLLDFINPASFNGLTFTFQNTSGGIETFAVGGTLNNAGLTNSTITVNGTVCTLGASCAPSNPSAVSVNGTLVPNPNFNGASPSPDANFIANSFKFSGSNIISESPYATSSGFGVVKPDNTTITATGGVLTATGLGGSGVQYNPTTTAYIVTSFSGLYDDGDSNSTNLGVPSSVSCSGGSPSTCTVAFAVAHGLSVGGAVDMFNLSAWPAGPAGLNQGAQYGSFQVTTVPDSTHITFTTPTTLTYSCAPCTGNIYDASYWGIWEMARTPFFYGHGTVYGFILKTADVVTNWAAIDAAVTGTPRILIDQSGQNDFAAGSTVSAVEGSHQSLWALAHTAGMRVIQTTMIPANYGVTTIGIAPAQVNTWYWNQSKTPSNVASGQYWDGYIDTAKALSAYSGSSPMPAPAANNLFASVMNEQMSNQNSLANVPPYIVQYSANALGGTQIPSWYLGSRVFTYDSAWNLFKDQQSGGSDTEIWYAQNATALHQYLWPTQGTNALWCSVVLGQAVSTNDSFGLCNFRVGAGSTSNYFSVRTSTDLFRAYADGTFSVPSVATSPSTSSICPNGTNGTFTTTGCTVSATNIPVVSVVTDTSTPVTVSITLPAEYHFNQNATAGTAVTYNLPTAASGKQFCFSNGNNGTSADTGILTIATSAAGQFITFTDGTQSASGGNVTSGGAAADAACVVGIDSTHWMLYTQRGTWTKH